MRRPTADRSAAGSLVAFVSAVQAVVAALSVAGRERNRRAANGGGCQAAAATMNGARCRAVARPGPGGIVAAEAGELLRGEYPLLHEQQLCGRQLDDARLPPPGTA
jgi:hypothetical protein